MLVVVVVVTFFFSFNDGVYVIYLRNSTDGKIIGEAAFFKTNEANKQKIYKNLNLGVSK